ncbi:MAG: hypothetical protein ABI579_06150, partial [Candidatus Sumerlaeota bacterium]
RDAMLLKAGASEELLKVSRADAVRLRESVQQLSMPSLLNTMQQFLELEERMRGAAPPRFLLEFAIIKLTAIHPKFVLDGIDASAAARGASTTSAPASSARVSAPTAAVPRAVLSYADAPKKTSNDTPRMMAAVAPMAVQATAPPMMRRATSAEPAMMPSDIEVGDEEQSEAMIDRFRERADARLKTHLRVFKDAKIVVDANEVHVTLRAGDGIVRPQLDKPEVMGEVRRAAVESFGRDYPIRITVAERTANIIPMEPPRDMDRGSGDSQGVSESSDDYALPRAVATSLSKKLSFEQALDKFPDFREAIDLVRKHCDALPVLFNGQRIN